MSDSRENPAMWRFPSVRGVAPCREGLGLGQRCDVAQVHHHSVDVGALGKELTGWADLPTGVDGATLESLGDLNGPVDYQLNIPADRHGRGGGPMPGRIGIREREVSLDEANAFHYRSDNQERRVATECSRQIAHEKSKEEYEQWRSRMSGPTSGCAECKVPYD